MNAPNYFATLDSNQAGISGTIGANTGVAFVTMSGTSLTVSIFHSQTIYGYVGQHIHGPAIVGVQGAGVVWSLCGVATGAARNCSGVDDWVIGQQFTGGNMTIITSGLAYLNVHTATYPAGSIRGQVVAGVAATAPTCTTSSTGLNGSGMLKASLSLVAVVALFNMLFQ